MNDSMRDTIQHLSVRWRGPEREAHTPALAMRVERLLRWVDWQPVGLRPGAILLIRHLRGLPPLQAGANLPFAWENLLRQQMDMLYRRAVRPIGGYVPPDAESILFDDPAELLACLTLETLERPSRATSDSGWYWSQIAGEGSLAADRGARLSLLWSAHAQALPKALTTLPVRRVYQAVGLFTSSDANRVISALTGVFALATMTAISQRPSLTSPVPQLPTADNEATPSSPAARLTSPPPPPWSDWLPSPPLLPRPAELLLGLCITLARSPTYARSAEFAARMNDWRASPPDLFPSQEGKNESNNEQSDALSPDAGHDTDSDRPVNRFEAARKPAVSSAAVSPQTGQDQPASWDVIFGGLAPLNADGLPTALGGVLYLIHLLAWLDLPAAWDARLSAWAVIEALAYGLLSTQAEAYADDLLWGILARLDNREPDTPLGIALEQPTLFRLSPLWLHRVGHSNVAVTVSVDNERLWLVSADDGFPLVDAPLTGRDADEAVAQEIAYYQAQGIVLHPTGFVPFAPARLLAALAPTSVQMLSPVARWWIERTAHFIEWMLSRLIDSETQLAPSPERLDGMLLYKPGHLAVSTTHIDLYLTMAQADIRLRSVGLDRDPGWIPDLGYIILFHFVGD
jgi:hypothetical protein